MTSQGTATGEPLLPSVKRTWRGEKARLVVLGSRRAASLKGPKWDDIRMGMGTSSVLAQALYDTGCFVLYEDNSAIRAQIERTWNTSGQLPSARAGAEYGALVTVDRFFLEDTSLFLGVAGAGTKKTIMNVTVELENLKTGRSTRASGRGTSTTATGGVLFLYESGTVNFDETTVGRATKAAVYDAVNRIKIP